MKKTKKIMGVGTCQYISKCKFIHLKLSDKLHLVTKYKQLFCFGNFTNCARFRIASEIGFRQVPINLYPKMKNRAEKIIDDLKQIKSCNLNKHTFLM